MPQSRPRLPTPSKRALKDVRPCHGAHGEGTAEAQFPRIAGKPAGYLFNQLKNFRDGQRSYPPMNYLVAYMNDDFLRELAGYFAAQPSRPPATPAASVLPASVEQSGREIATQGDAAHGVPACVLCHGKGLAGIEPGIPGLIGLDGRYITAQLVSWRVGTRHAGAPDCMHQVAEHLTESQIRAVSSWLGTQTPADAARPGRPRHLDDAARVWESTMRSDISQAIFLAAALLLTLDARAVDRSAANEAATDAISRGEYLVHAGDCVACHTQQGGAPFAGGFALPTPFGTLYSPNITPDPAAGLGTWSAGQFYDMLHTGRSRDGTLLYPAMPFPSYTKITRADSDAIFAYLRSLKPVRKANRQNELRFPYDNRSLLYGWRLLYFKEGEFVPAAGRSAQFNRGAYLVEGLGHCASCHSTINALGGSNSDSAFAGGLIPLQNWYAPSLTSNQESGLGSWSVAEIAGFLKAGTSAKGAVYGPMAEATHNSLQYLTVDDATSMATYLKSLLQLSPAVAAPDVGNGRVARHARARRADVYESLRGLSPHGRRRNASGLPAARGQSVDRDGGVRESLAHGAERGFPPQTADDPRPTACRRSPRC